MRAIILAGGLGTRLRPYTTVIPKPLVPIGDRPVLEHIIRSLADAGVEHIHLCVNHLGQLIRSYLDHTDLPPGLELTFHWETQPLGTAGALSAVGGLEGSFIVMNGDVLTTLDYGELVDFHHDKQAALTIAMHCKRVEIDLGVIDAVDGIVHNYIEKPAFRYRVSTGVYVYHERALRHLSDGPCQFPELVLRLLAAGERVAAWETDAEWFDIGTVGEYERAAADVERSPERYHMDPVDLPPLEAPLALAPVNGKQDESEWRLTASPNGDRP